IAIQMYLPLPFTGDDMHAARLPESDGESAPLYWVAPMDPNYRRDKPGKSPMGMDLVPVYEEDMQGGDQGMVKISPVVVNNLGVRVAAVEAGQMSIPIQTVGYVTFDEERLVHIHGRVDGWIEQLNVNSEGDPVRKGETLYELYSPTLVNAQEEFLSAQRSGSAELKKASGMRLQSLGLSENQISALEKRGRAEQRIHVSADLDGVVSQLNVRQGMYVKPATEVMSIGSLESVWVIAEVFERQASWVQPGQKVVMTVSAMPGRVWEGKVDYLYPVLDSKTRTLRVRVRFPNMDGILKPNMFAELIVYAEVSDHALSIPAESLIRGERYDRVVVQLAEGAFKTVIVRAGHEGGGRVQILDGLSAEDKVVVSAQFLIDSESNIDAELARLESRDSEPEIAKVTASGTVQGVMAETAMLSINHDPIEAWGWPTMKMDFPVAESVDIGRLETGQVIEFELTRQREHEYLITSILEKPAEQETNLDDSDQMAADHAEPMAEAVKRVTATGEIRELIPEMGMVEMVHDPIPDWNWPTMTMSFSLADPDDLNALSPGQRIRFSLTESESGDYILSEPEPLEIQQ
ncbi:efflux RND transporter periplasmic adaptor subunit, partial [Pseudomonadota bacterium]